MLLRPFSEPFFPIRAVGMSTQTTTTTKASLRRFISERVHSLGHSEKQRQAELVAGCLWQHPKYIAARQISLYLSTSNEIDTTAILRRALEVSQKRCFIPYTGQTIAPTKLNSGQRDGDKAPRMRMVEIKSMSQYESLPLNKYGIREPNKDNLSEFQEVELGQLDLILVPGVAFSRDGRRLGHGKGYYDEFLAHWRRSTPNKQLYSIGLALKEQIVSETLAQDEHDYVLDEILAAS